ncbi:MAG: response regulator [Myxococcota bacterium]
MLVDDSRVMRQLVRRTLRQAGYDFKTIIEAENGQDALAKIAAHKPGLVLSDWNMPVMNGIDLLVKLRELGNKVPLGFVTSESTASMKARAAGSGASFVLTKPFTAEDMRAAMIAAGIKPNLAVKIGDASDIPLPNTFGHKLLSKLLSHVVNVPVTVNPGPKLVVAVTPCVSTTWIDDENHLQYAGFCELPLAASMGAALGLRPPSAVAEMLRTRTLPDALQADSREVFNVLSRAFNDCQSVHVRLSEISFPPAPPLPVARTLDTKAASRLDFVVQVQGFGTGKLSLVSATPEFILTEVKAAEAKLAETRG